MEKKCIGKFAISTSKMTGHPERVKDLFADMNVIRSDYFPPDFCTHYIAESKRFFDLIDYADVDTSYIPWYNFTIRESAPISAERYDRPVEPEKPAPKKKAVKKK